VLTNVVENVLVRKKKKDWFTQGWNSLALAGDFTVEQDSDSWAWAS
jgi:hypothetical protein